MAHIPGPLKPKRDAGPDGLEAEIVELRTGAQFRGGPYVRVRAHWCISGAPPVQSSRPAVQGGEAGSFDQETRDAIARYRFRYPLEQQFQDSWLDRNLPRARSATTIYLTLVLVVTVINCASASPALRSC